MTVATPSPFPRLSYALALSNPDAFIPLLRSALLTTGFFYLVDIPTVIPEWEHSWDALFASCEELFALPQEEKERIAMTESRHFRGYSAVGVEVTAGKRDLREQIDLGYALATSPPCTKLMSAPSPETRPYIPYPPSPTDPIELSLYGPNLYPSLPSFEPSLAAYRVHCSSISQHLLTLFADSLTPHPELLTSLFRSETPKETPDYSRMKVVRYPAEEEGETGGSLGVGAHKDGGGLTLLAQDSVGGLEVQRWDGIWVPVEPVPYSLVINVGQVLSVSLLPLSWIALILRRRQRATLRLPLPRDNPPRRPTPSRPPLHPLFLLPSPHFHPHSPPPLVPPPFAAGTGEKGRGAQGGERGAQGGFA